MEITVALYCLVISFPLIFFFFFNYRYQSQIKTPCPSSYPLIGNIIAFLRNRHRFHDWVADMLSQTPSNTLEVHGFLGSFRVICTANPVNIDHFLRSNFSNYIKGSRFHDVLYELLGDGIFNVDSDLWISQRKISSHELNTRSLKSFIDDTVQSEILDRLLPCLSTACDKSETIDLQEIFRKFTFDNICKLVFGEDPACLDLDQTVTDRSSSSSSSSSSSYSFVRAFDEAVEICSSRFMSPIPLIWKLKRIINVGSEKRLRETVNVIDNYAMKIIKSKEGQDEEYRKSNQDLLSRFMSSDEKFDYQDLDHKRRLLRDIIISFIFAGKDTTSTALTWFFWVISGNLHCQCRILAELPNNKTGIFNYEDLKQMNYLHAAISESLRLFPPLPHDSRLTVKSDVLPDGTYVGAGWFADYSAYAMGRMERVWGPDCKEFVPERWLDEDGVFQPSDQFRFPVFHAGPRMCLGREMAYVQMKSIAASLLYAFEVEAVDGGGEDVGRLMHPPYMVSLLLKMKGGLPVRLKKRNRS